MSKFAAFWKSVWAWLKRIFRVSAAPIIAVVVVAIAILLIAIGVKNVQIGGILGRLFGKKDPETRAVDVANTIDEDRVDQNGNLIRPGEPDSKGITQAKVVPIETPGLFDDPSKVKVVLPGEDKPTEILLPDGVQAKDVDKVVVVKPEVVVVSVKDNSGIPAKKVDELLAKYGK